MTLRHLQTLSLQFSPTSTNAAAVRSLVGLDLRSHSSSDIGIQYFLPNLLWIPHSCIIDSFLPAWCQMCVLHNRTKDYLIKYMIVICWMPSKSLTTENPAGNCSSQGYRTVDQCLACFDHSQDSSQNPVVLPHFCCLGVRLVCHLPGMSPQQCGWEEGPWVCSFPIALE